MPESTPQSGKLPSPRLLKLLAAAFGIGLLLFVLVWLSSRHDYDFYKADGSTGSAEPGDALPAPLPADVAGNDNASGLQVGNAPSNAPVPAPTQPRIIQAPATPAAPALTPAGTPVPAASPSDRSQPEPLQMPAPRYPRSALRLGLGGTVRIKVWVAADGSVERMDISQGSGNRDLDRAALEAVRRWRFRPATRNGQPVASEAVVPISFNPQG